MELNNHNFFESCHFYGQHSARDQLVLLQYYTVVNYSMRMWSSETAFGRDCRGCTYRVRIEIDAGPSRADVKRYKSHVRVYLTAAVHRLSIPTTNTRPGTGYWY